MSKSFHKPSHSTMHCILALFLYHYIPVSSLKTSCKINGTVNILYFLTSKIHKPFLKFSSVQLQHYRKKIHSQFGMQWLDHLLHTSRNKNKKWIHVVHNKEQTVDRTYIHCTVHGKKKLNIASVYDANLKTIFVDRINCCVSLCAHVFWSNSWHLHCCMYSI